jgi:C1A family cysteine protease
MKTNIHIIITLLIIAGVLSTFSTDSLTKQKLNKKSFINEQLEKMSGEPHKRIFKAFHFYHKKTYKLNSQEGLDRYRIFKKNMKWVNEENKKLGKTIYGITKFMDMTHEEFVQKTLMKPEAMKKIMNNMNKKSMRFLQDDDSNNKHHDDNDHHHDDDHHHDHHHHDHHHHDDHHHDHHNVEKIQKTNKKVNKKFSNGNIDHMKWESPAKDQGGCGSCWAFAAVAAIENKYFALSGKLTLFSEQYLVDCDNLDGGCDGGWPSETIQWISSNGLIKSNLLEYKGAQGVCDSSLEKNRYKIVNGFEAIEDGQPSNVKFEDLLSKGPLIVAMDAGFEGFGLYNPVNFDVINPPTCSNVNHAVTAVSLLTENGQRNIVVKNSWGKHWGYNGYFKIPYNKSCGITNFAWLPKVYKGTVPSDDPAPNPIPVPVTTNCVDLYYTSGFQGEVIQSTCDSLPNVEPTYFFLGLKYKNTPFKIRAFEYPECEGDEFVELNASTEYIRNADRSLFLSSSLAYVKSANTNCVNFYMRSCHQGQPDFIICKDINDTQLVNFSQLPNVLSVLPDIYSIKSITFFTKPNFEGEGFTISGEAIYNVHNNWELASVLGEGEVRSVKIERL